MLSVLADILGIIECIMLIYLIILIKRSDFK